PLRGRRRMPAHDVGRAAYAPDRSSRPRQGADPLHPVHPRPPPGMGVPPRRHRPPLDRPLPRTGVTEVPCNHELNRLLPTAAPAANLQQSLPVLVETWTAEPPSPRLRGEGRGEGLVAQACPSPGIRTGCGSRPR